MELCLRTVNIYLAWCRFHGVVLCWQYLPGICQLFLRSLACIELTLVCKLCLVLLLCLTVVWSSQWFLHVDSASRSDPIALLVSASTLKWLNIVSHVSPVVMWMSSPVCWDFLAENHFLLPLSLCMWRGPPCACPSSCRLVCAECQICPKCKLRQLWIISLMSIFCPSNRSTAPLTFCKFFAPWVVPLFMDSSSWSVPFPCTDCSALSYHPIYSYLPQHLILRTQVRVLLSHN